MTVDRYFAMQAAIPGGCYADALNNYPKFSQQELTKPTPDTASDLGYRLYLAAARQRAGKIINFYNINDYALYSGVYPVLGNVSWEQNQLDYKPNSFTTVTYAYDKGPPTNGYEIGKRCFLRNIYTQNERSVFDIHESMSYIARPRSKALGAEPNSLTAFSDSVNLGSQAGFDGRASDHSGQFNRTIQQLHDFYYRIYVELQ